MKASELIDEAAERFRDSPDVELSWKGEDRDQAKTLLAHVLGIEPDAEFDVPKPDAARFRRLVSRREKGEPVAYIVGWTEFSGLRIGVRRGGFVPRSTTEFLAEMAVRRLRQRHDAVCVDVACGIGPVALTVAWEVPDCEVHGTDISEGAIAQARRNARDLELDNVTFHAGDLFDALPDRLDGYVDVITIHPPYVPKREVADLPREIREYEPVHTLTDGSSDGLGLVHRVVDECWEWLCEGGWLLMEIHPSDVRYVKGLMQRTGFTDVRSHKGELQWTRVLAGRA